MRQLLLAATFLALPALAQDKPAPPKDAKAEARAKQLAQAEAWEAMQRDAGGGDGDGWVRGGTRGPGR